MTNANADALAWAEEQFAGCELGDLRRTRRLVDVAAHLASHAGQSISSVFGGDSAANEGAYRLVRNDAVDPEAIATGGFAATAAACEDVETLVAAEDTTSLSYRHAVAEVLGELGGPSGSRSRGFLVHSVLLLDADSERTVGLIEQQRWCREAKPRGRAAAREYAERESYKWQRSSERMTERLGMPTMSRVISVCDREADVYEYLRYKQSHEQRFVVRASHWDRRVEEAPARLMLEAVRAEPALGQLEVDIAQRGGKQGRRGRKVALEIRAREVELGTRPGDERPGRWKLNVVLATEVVDESEPMLHWLLLTSEPIDSFETAARVVHLYRLRWRVEEFHKAWKSGAGVEELRLQSAGNLERLAVVLAFIGVRLLQLREVVADGIDPTHAEAPCTEVLSTVQWRVLWVQRNRSRPPRKPPTIRWAYHNIAKLGGWQDTKRTGRVGWDTYWRGWARLQDAVDTYLATQKHLA